MVDALLWQAKTLAEDGELDEALRLCSEILNTDPDRPEALFIVGYCFLKAERNGLAYAVMRRTAEIAPQQQQVWNNLGLISAKLNRFDEAEQYLQQSLTIDPTEVAAINNLALISVNQCLPEQAVQYARQSLAMNPDQNDVKETLGYACLMLRQWKDGWAGYEAAVDSSKYRQSKAMGKEPYWQGQKGIKLLIRGEQGLGDEISFSSILQEAAEGNQTTMECDRRLQGLFERSFPGIRFIGSRFQKRRGWEDEFDAHCLIGSAAQYYRQRDEDFPGTPYLIPDPERCLQWHALLDCLPGAKIGIAWTGGKMDTFTKRRSLMLEELLPILRVPGVSWISLQYKDPVAEIAEFTQKTGIKIRHWARAAEAVDYDETAALVSQLDMVVCVTTAAVDLCGALGKPCWVLVPSKPHWRYGLSGDSKLWYKSVRLFRQTSTWAEIIGQLGESLAQHLHRNGFAPAAGVHGTAEQHHSPGLQTRPDLPLDPLAAACQQAWAN